jgi:uncharacterized protein
MFTRPFIDSLDFAHRGGELSGEVPVAELPRLADALADTAGKVSYTLGGFIGKDGKPQLVLRLEGECNLRCQRCLNALPYPIKLQARLRLVAEGELGSDDIEDDEVDSIPADKHFDVLALIEEELLLAMPIAPKHDSGECEIATEGLNRSNNPFAVLAGLKK